jgi:hypothetical protein
LMVERGEVDARPGIVVHNPYEREAAFAEVRGEGGEGEDGGVSDTLNLPSPIRAKGVGLDPKGLAPLWTSPVPFPCEGGGVPSCGCGWGWI